MKTSAFLAASLSLFGCLFCGCEIEEVSSFIDDAQCNLRIGVLSDVHLASPHSDKTLLKAFAYFVERRVDAVVIAGDVTRDGSVAQRRNFKALWDKAFSKVDVRLLVVTGERDNEQVYENLTSEKYASVFSRNVKGYTFIGANWKGAAHVDAWALKPLLANTDRSKPFFYIENLIPYATCCPQEGRMDVYEGGKISYMLSKFPNAVAICGRSHTPLTDEAAFWHGDFTCVNAGTFSHAKMRGNDGLTKKDVRHGLIVSVYDSSIVFERLDFGQEAKERRGDGVHVEKLGPDWKVPLPAVPSVRPATPAPQFWDDTRLLVFPSPNVVSIRFPPVLAKHTGVRAYGYEVSAKGPDGAEVSSCLTWSPGFCSSEERETKPVSVNFPRRGMPKGRVRFDVTPIDAFGQRGRTISGEATL